MNALFRLVAYFGIQIRRNTRKCLRTLKRQLSKPLTPLLVWCRILVLAIDFFFVQAVRRSREEQAVIKKEIASASANLKKTRKENFSSSVRLFFKYCALALVRHKKYLKSAFNTALPILMIVVLLVEINYWNSFTYALRVKYGDETIGYIANESVYLDARNKALEKLSIGYDGDSSELLETPKYELSLVSVNELIDSSSLSENLISASDENITNACGIFIDGEFLCSVKNENDARSVFNAILETVHTDIEDATLGFLQEIDYVQGLYPDNENTMWDADRLAQKLSTPKSEAEYYIAQPGDSFSKIASDNSLTIGELKIMNPQLGDTILVGTMLLVREQENYVTPKVTHTEVYREEVICPVEVTYNSKLFQGDRRIIREGKNGTDLVTVSVTTVNGVIYDKEEIGRVTISEPVSQKVELGTASGGNYYGGQMSSKGFVWPTPTAKTISQRFGRYGHKGLDITTSRASGHVIVAAASGTVEIAGSTGNSYGQQVLINHGNGIKTRYAHCLYGSIVVRPGQYVSAGQKIGKIGSTGNSTGPHLHFEVIVNGRFVNPLNYVSR